jgi:glycosyltransferase involved in cell wall biosynthesis
VRADAGRAGGIEMKIGIYARGLSGIGGVKQYIESMTRAIINNLSDGDELFVVHNKKSEYFSSTKSNVREILLHSENRMICDFVLAPSVIRRLDLDVVWFTKYVVPFFLNAKTVATVHDMAYYLPDLFAYTASDTLFMRALIRSSCARADKIVAVSENTKQDIVRLLGVFPEKVRVIHEAADDKYKLITDKARLTSFRDKYGLDKKYFLFTGGISPRKNLARLIHAFDRISSKTEHVLVLTGAKGWKNKEVLDLIKKNDRVIKLGFVDDDDMVLLYNLADLFVYPSLYEGFGLPVLEAQSCGCPVICSKNSSLEEVGGDGVCFVDPNNIEDIFDKMLKVVEDTKLREDLVERGFANAKRFSWDKAAGELLKIIATFGWSISI